MEQTESHIETHDHNQNQNHNHGSKHPVLMGILAYLGLLVIFPYAFARHDPFVKFHIKQGLVLLFINVILMVIGSTFWTLRSLISLLNFAVFILAVVGIVNVLKKREVELPLVGSFSKHFNNI